MKILFSVYNEELFTGNLKFIDSLLVHTNWSVQQIESHIALHEGFRSQVSVGENIAFFDYYCFYADSNDVISKIKTIPQSTCEEQHKHTPFLFRVSTFDSGNTDAPEYPNNEQFYLYSSNRYECGASGYQAIVYWASQHPFAMMFIGGFVYDICKLLFLKLFNFFASNRDSTTRAPVILSTKRLYRNFCKHTNNKINDCQIVKMHRLKIGVFHVQIQTLTGKKFKLKCRADGVIESIEEISRH